MYSISEHKLCEGCGDVMIGILKVSYPSPRTICSDCESLGADGAA